MDKKKDGMNIEGEWFPKQMGEPETKAVNIVNKIEKICFNMC